MCTWGGFCRFLQFRGWRSLVVFIMLFISLLGFIFACLADDPGDEYYLFAFISAIFPLIVLWQLVAAQYVLLFFTAGMTLAVTAISIRFMDALEDEGMLPPARPRDAFPTARSY